MAPSTLSLVVQDFSQHHWPVSSRSVWTLQSVSGRVYLLVLVDLVLSHLVLGPFVVAFWRGVWSHSREYLDTGLCGGDLVLANAVAVVVGVAGCTAVHVFQYEVRAAAGDPATLRYTLIARAFSLWWGFFFVYLWKGLWDGLSACFLGDYSNLSINFSCMCLAMGFFSLSFTGTSHSGVGCPIGITPDLTPSHFHAPTLLSFSPSDGWLCRVIDGLLSNLVQIMAVLAWYGTWTIQDILLEEWLHLPHLTSALASTIGAFLLSFLLLLLQLPLLHLRHLQRSSPSSAGLLLATQVSSSLSSLLACVSGYSSFRGGWYLWDIFYLASLPQASAITGGVMGAGGLLVMGATACLHGGVKWDGVLNNPMTTPYYYTSYYYIQRVQQSDSLTNHGKKDSF